jgi:hypothetical protein
MSHLRLQARGGQAGVGKPAFNMGRLSQGCLPVITPFDILQDQGSFCFEEPIDLINFVGNKVIEVANGFGIEFRINFRRTGGMNNKPYLIYLAQVF